MEWDDGRLCYPAGLGTDPPRPFAARPAHLEHERGGSRPGQRGTVTSSQPPLQGTGVVPEFPRWSPPVLPSAHLADPLSLSRKTIDEWVAKDILQGCCRKRDKHLLIWRGKTLDLLLNGPDWRNPEE